MLPYTANEVEIEKFNVGRIGENLVSYYLERNGIECSVVDRRGADVWAKVPHGKMFSLEVKTASEPSEMKKAYKDKVYSYPQYAFSFSKKEADQYALVCLDTSLMRVIDHGTLSLMSKSSMLYCKEDFFSEEKMYEDITRLYATYMPRS